MRRRWIWILGGVLSLSALLLLTPGSHRTLHDAWLPSSHNPGRAGYLAIYETLSEAGWPVARWSEPLSRLQGTGGTLILARAKEGAMVKYTKEEAALLEHWVSIGNTLLLAGDWQRWDDTAEVLRTFKVPVPVSPGGDSLEAQVIVPIFGPRKMDAVAISAQAPLPKPLVIPAVEPLPALLPATAQVLWNLGSTTYIAKIPHGQGQVIWIASPALLSNQWILQGHNLDALLTLLQEPTLPQHLWFEETHNGFSSSFALAQLLHHPGLRFAGFLALFGGFIFLGSSLVRFGEVRPLPLESKRSYLEFINSMADLYRRADLRNETILALYQETRLRILVRLHLPETAGDQEISDRLIQAHPHLPQWKKLAHRFTTKEYYYGLPPGGWFRLACELIQIKQTIA